MFNKGDCIVYGTNGVCRVTEVCDSPFGNNDSRSYYALNPLNDKGSVIYTPVEGGRIPFRPLYSKEEIEKLLDRMDDIPGIVVKNEKQRRDSYRVAMSSASPEAYISIIKTVAKRRENAFENHRQLAVTDAEYERQAKNCLYSEFALVLGLPLSEVEGYIRGRKKTKKSLPLEGKVSAEG